MIIRLRVEFNKKFIRYLKKKNRLNVIIYNFIVLIYKGEGFMVSMLNYYWLFSSLGVNFGCGFFVNVFG